MVRWWNENRVAGSARLDRRFELIYNRCGVYKSYFIFLCLQRDTIKWCNRAP